jgi:hypothetical protein
MQGQNYERKISILDWGIIISALLLLLAVYLPQSIWQEEEKFKKEGRKRMSDIANAEDFYFEMTGNYTLDGKHLFALVEAAMDSLIADSLFTGKKNITLGGKTYPVTLESGFEIRVDTTFSNPTELYFSYEDTVYCVGLRNLASGGTDTLFVNVRDLSAYQADENFQEILNTDIVTRSELRTDYLRKKYHLNNSLLNCPITLKPYIFKIDSTDNEAIFQVTSPLHILDKPYKESRFGVFTFEAGDHGYIRNDQTSWAE